MLALTWLGIIGFCIIMYVILDGFTLGTGMLLPFLKESQRDIAMSVILPTWDGNQTWLVLGMASLYGAFPLAFSILLPALYLPLLIMVVALLMRGVAFEFRMKSQQGKVKWDWIFTFSAIVVTLVEGWMLGDFVQGFNQVAPMQFAAVDFNWFNVLTALSLVIGYTLLGATRLILKTEAAIQQRMFAVSKVLAVILIVLIGIVSLWTPFVYPLAKTRWFNWHYLPYLAILPLITGLSFVALFVSLAKKYESVPYWLSVVLFLCPYIGFIISVFPYVVSYHITIWEAAAPDNTLKFILVGALVMLPVLLAYTFYAYRIFKGKVNESLHY